MDRQNEIISIFQIIIKIIDHLNNCLRDEWKSESTKTISRLGYIYLKNIENEIVFGRDADYLLQHLS